MGKPLGAKLPQNDRLCDREPQTRNSKGKFSENQTKVGIYLDRESATKLRRIAEAASMPLGRAVAELLCFALETLSQKKKQREWERQGSARRIQ
jgi:hypothetical protein